MSKLPALSSQQVIEILKKAGFYVSHSKGSHIKLRDHFGHTTIVPFHRGDIKGGS